MMSYLPRARLSAVRGAVTVTNHSIALCAVAFFTPTSKLRRIGVTISSRRSGLYAPLANLSRMHPPWFSASNWDMIDFSITFCSRVGFSRVRPRLA
jgi:hypothetical protein